MFNNIFGKSCLCELQWRKYIAARQTIDDNTIRRKKKAYFMKGY